jgi:hypothetical protein
MKAVITRLRRLEVRFESRIAAMQPPCPSPVPFIAELLDLWGVVRDGNESLMEAFARALGMSCRELRAELMRRAGMAWTPNPARLERLESRFAPAAEPIVLQVVYIAPDGSSEEGPRYTVPGNTKPPWRDSGRWKRNGNAYR